MGLLLTVNFNKYYSGVNPGQPENERPPRKKSRVKMVALELLLGVGLTYKADPYMNVAKATVGKVLEVLTVSPEHAAVGGALLCYAAVCAAPMIILWMGRYLLTE